MSATSMSRAFVAPLLAACLVLGAFPSAALAAAPAGNVVVSGQILDLESGRAISGAVVHAVHLDTKEVYSSGATGGDGTYLIERIPFGYYDLAVEANGRLFLSNRVISAPAGEAVEYSMLLGPPRLQDSQWWSADPNRRVPGLDRTPDGVGQIVEGIPTRKARASTPKPPKAPRAPRVRSGGRGWLLPALTAVGLAGLAAAAEDDEEYTYDAGASPF